MKISIILVLACLANIYCLDSYTPLDINVWKELECNSNINVICMDPNFFLALKKGNVEKFNEIKSHLQEMMNKNGSTVDSKLSEELNELKSKLNLENLNELRKTAYSQKSLVKELQVNRIIELEKFIKAK